MKTKFEDIKRGDTIEFYVSSNADRKLYKGKVEYKDQLGLISVVDGVQYELRKLVDIKVLKQDVNNIVGRTIKLSHDEIETIKIALQYVYDRKLDMVKQNRKVLGEEATAKILEQANKYFDTQDVFDGDRDV
jgi:hypothetical protein